ncbi:MAG: hypothetical protein K8T10_08415 [Candidatus Eremiobacteraeota bacterium]|nr:hypothetical protein [Candidatus Eremiobacteraeota bacterium]
MGQIYRVEIKRNVGDINRCGIRLSGFTSEEDRIIRNGIFKDDNDRKTLSRKYNIGDISNLYQLFKEKSFLCSDKFLDLIRPRFDMEKSSLHTDKVLGLTKLPIKNFESCCEISSLDFTWEELLYVSGSRPSILKPGESFPYMCMESKQIKSVEDTEIE